MAIYFRRNYDEAYDLLVEARNYMAFRAPTDGRHGDLDARLAYNCEAFRLTSRLTQVMAWLMFQRAVHDGEITWQEAASAENRLSGHAVCLADDAPPDTLPPIFRSLLDRSRSLFSRIDRLDSLFDDASFFQSVSQTETRPQA